MTANSPQKPKTNSTPSWYELYVYDKTSAISNIFTCRDDKDVTTFLLSKNYKVLKIEIRKKYHGRNDKRDIYCDRVSESINQAIIERWNNSFKSDKKLWLEYGDRYKIFKFQDQRIMYNIYRVELYKKDKSMFFNGYYIAKKEVEI